MSLYLSKYHFVGNHLSLLVSVLPNKIIAKLEPLFIMVNQKCVVYLLFPASSRTSLKTL